VCGASDLERLLFWILKRMIEMMNELWFCFVGDLSSLILAG
jgi:hypothetical protein